ncbi:MAG: hypothetical protein A2045_07700 [Rhodocyclales bacterium GWA2_65_20]|nr:MAG: hypothetical protein A2045_07700 [Rhodocyclales bacterium GWA2_65_20]
MAHSFGDVVLVPFPFTDQSGAQRRPAGLIKPSVFKPVFTTIEQGLVLRTMGTLSATDLRILRETITQVIG